MHKLNKYFPPNIYLNLISCKYERKKFQPAIKYATKDVIRAQNFATSSILLSLQPWHLSKG